MKQLVFAKQRVFLAAHTFLRDIKIYGNVVELGSGGGWLSMMLSRIKGVTNVTAIDNDNDRIKHEREIYQNLLAPNDSILNFHNKDFHSLPIEWTNSFDFSIFCNSLHHAEDINLALEESYRITKPGGQVILFGEHYRAKYTIKGKKGGPNSPHTITEFKHLLKAAGFNPKTVRYFLPPLNATRWKTLVKCLFPQFLNGYLQVSDFLMIGEKK